VTGLPVTERPLTLPRAARRESRSRAAGQLRRHWPLLVLLAAAAALRALALVAVYPGIWFSDTNSYVRPAVTGTLSVVRVVGYSLVVAPFWHARSAAALIVLQHVLGLAIVVALYALLIRRGVPRGFALLAVVPAALDAYVVDSEHMIMAETVFHAVLVAVLVLLLWRERPGLPATAVAGLLLGYAAVLRSVALPFVALFVAYLVLRGVGVRRVVAFLAGWAAVAGAYVALFDAQHHHLGFTQFSGRFLYGQVAPFADCAKLAGLPRSERFLCPVASRPLSRNGYLWNARSPVHRLPDARDPLVGDFAKRVIAAQPLEYLRLVATSFAHYFVPGHWIGGNDYPVSAWQFPSDPSRWGYPGYRGPIRPSNPQRPTNTGPGRYIRRMARHPHTNATASGILHDYQRFAYSSGQVLLPCLGVVLAGLLVRRGSRRLRLDAALIAGMALTALLVVAALSVFDYRYALGATILLPAAAALAGTTLRTA
jgi:hypothetical protein